MSDHSHSSRSAVVRIALFVMIGATANGRPAAPEKGKQLFM